MEKKKLQKNRANKKPQKFQNNNKANKPVFNGKPKRTEDAEINALKNKYPTINPKNVTKFTDLPLSKKTRRGLENCKYSTPTEIQRQSIGSALQGRDILGAAITGSGKTLAFLIPVMERLFVKKWTRQDGIGAIIISPTRELAYQIFETLKKIGTQHDFSAGLIIGGKNLKFERTRMDQCNVIICTPGRLLQHMDENPLFNCTSMQVLVLDEADRCLDMGFEKTMNAIIENLPPDRQTLLFSATQTKSVKDLSRLSLTDPVYVAPHEQSAHITPVALKQNYVVIELEEKLTMLWSFIKNHLKQKCIVFLSTCKQVKYFNEILTKLRPGVSILALYGTLHQDRRMAVYDEFCRKSSVVLLATDVASRGLDFPVVNWVIQLDCPEDANAYIHRAGRTARHTAQGESLLVLLPSEEDGMIKELNERKIVINKIQVDPKKMFTPRAKIESFLAQKQDLKESAQRALVNYVKSVALMKNKEVFKVEALNIEAFAQSLGLIMAPRVKILQRFMWNAEKRRAAIKQEEEINKIEKSECASSGDDSETEENDDENESVSESESSNESDGNEESEHETLPHSEKATTKAGTNFSASDDDDDDADDGDDLITIKRRDHEILEENLPEVPDLEDIKAKKQAKVLTKAAVAKRLIKKKILPNKKVAFDEEGNELEGVNTLKSELAKAYAQSIESGIDIEKARELIKEEDKFDKERFKQLVKAKRRDKKKNLKKDDKNGEQDGFGSESESDGPDLSWLPDPDKNRAPIGDVSDSDNDIGMRQVVNSSSSEETESEENEAVFSKKRRYKNDDEAESDENSDDFSSAPSTSKKIRKIASKLSVDAAETFAMRLLTK